jgi:hypothetical protein
MKSIRLVSFSALVLLEACSQRSGFKAGVNERDLAKARDEVAKPEPLVVIPKKKKAEDVSIIGQIIGEFSDLSSPVEPKVISEIKLALEVKVSAPEVRAGQHPIQAEAVFTPSAPPNAKILWTLEGTPGVDLGTIDPNGRYLSPAKATSELMVTIVATFDSTPMALTAKKVIKVVPADQLFVGCQKANITFPITADVFKLPPATARLPDFSKLMRDDTVCLDKYDIPLQSWEVGFPGVPTLQEWFGLHSKAKIAVDQDGVYEFRVYSDDGAKVYIDGAILLDNDGIHAATAVEGSLSLTKGKHDIVLDYYQGPRTQVALQLYWKTPKAKEFLIVPASAFSAD